MIMQRLKGISTVIALGAVLAAATASAESMSCSIGETGTIQSASGETRALFKVSGLDRLGSVALRRATLTIPYTLSRAEDRRVELRVMPVTTDWSSGSVSWDAGWTASGGDCDEALYARGVADFSSTSGSVTFDVTVAMKELLEEGASFYGFLVTGRGAAGGLASADAAVVGQLASATLDLSYKTTLGAPPGMGHRGRQKSRPVKKTTTAEPLDIDG
jgi:hypothetical protein